MSESVSARQHSRGGPRGRGRGSYPSRGGRGGRGGSGGPRHSHRRPDHEEDSRALKGSRGGHTGMQNSDKHRGAEGSGKDAPRAGPPPPTVSSSAQTEQNQEDGSSESEAEEAEVSIFERTALDLASNPLPACATLGATLSKFTNLRKLDLGNMQPGSPEDESEDDAGNTRGLETLRFLEVAQVAAEKERRKQLKGKAPASDSAQASGRKTLADTLTVLNLAGNPALGEGRQKSAAAPFRGLELIKSLFVLNASSCSLRTPPPRTSLINLTELRALILSNNRLTTSSLQELPYLPNLNTLVLSHNKIENLPLTFPANFPQLAKLSISHNRLGGKASAKARASKTSDDSDDSDSDEEDDGEATFPDFSASKALREVRLSHNPQLSRLASHLPKWGRGSAGDGRGLDLLDVGHCNLKWSHVRQLLLVGAGEGNSMRGGLKNLTLAGNPDVEDEEDYREQVRNALPGLVVLDNQRFVEKSKRDSDRLKEIKKAKKGKQGHGQEQVSVEDGPAQWGNKGRRPSEDEGDGGDTSAQEPSDLKVPGSSTERKRTQDTGRSSSSLDADDPRGPKKRKRGGRGGASARKDGAAGSSSDEDSDDDEDEHRRRILARAGPSDGDDAAVASDEEDARGAAPADGSKKKKRAKRGNAVKNVLMGLGRVDDDEEEEKRGSSRKSKKSKKDADIPDNKESKSKSRDKPAAAWDEVQPPAGTDADENKAQQGSDKKANKAQTSVAGIVEVKKHKSAKGKQPRATPAQDVEAKPATKPFSLGAGSGGSSWTTGGDVGEGGSAWD